MGIDARFLDRISQIGKREGLFPGSSVMVLGDCKFYAPWACGNNREDLAHFKQLFGLSRVETIDIAGEPSVRLDLQQPLPSELIGQFDLVIDAGTLFWCFDIAAVLENCLAALKDRGSVIHVCALTGHFGRGYYNIHPKMFRDFYEQNGFRILSTEVRVHKQTSRLANLQRKFWEWRGRPVGEYVPIGKDELFLKQADFVSMDFTDQIATGARMLPNDALFLCAAARQERLAFVRPIP